MSKSDEAQTTRLRQRDGTTRSVLAQCRLPIVVVTMLAATFGAFFLLGWRETLDGPESTSFVAGAGWSTYKSLAAISVTIWMIILLSGVRELRAQRDQDHYWTTIAAYLTFAGLLVVEVGVILLHRGGYTPDMPVNNLALRSRALLLVAASAALPWITLTWLAYARTAKLAVEHPRQRAETHPGRTIKNLLDTWRLMTSCVIAFAALVVTALVTSGALRAAFIGQFGRGDLRADAFPPQAVLLYGVFFAAVLAGVTLPLVSSWRASAMKLVDDLYAIPQDGRIEQSWESDRGRLERVLHVDAPLIRNPLTALGVLAPLGTAALSAFIPLISIVP